MILVCEIFDSVQIINIILFYSIILASAEEERFKCKVNGKTYLDGESFYPDDNPKLSCRCMEGYKGKRDLL